MARGKSSGEVGSSCSAFVLFLLIVFGIGGWLWMTKVIARQAVPNASHNPVHKIAHTIKRSIKAVKPHDINQGDTTDEPEKPLNTQKAESVDNPKLSPPAVQMQDRQEKFTPTKKSTNDHVVSLTFDAGSEGEPLHSILQTLKENNLHATFFLTGKFCQQFPWAAKAIIEGGHEIGNHSYSHPHFTRLSALQIQNQIIEAQTIIEKSAGTATTHLFRPPYGDRDKRVDGLIKQMGYKMEMWTLDSHDSVVKGITDKQIKERVLSKIKPNDIVLMHCGSAASAKALPEIIKGLQEKGYHLVPISEM